MTQQTVREPDIDRQPIHPHAPAQPVGAARGALRAISRRTRPDLKRAIPAAVVSLLSYLLGQKLGGLGRRGPLDVQAFGLDVQISAGYATALVVVLTAIFVITGVVATRSVAREIGRFSEYYGGPAAATPVRLVCQLLGLGLIGLGLLSLLQVDLAALLVGGAVTGVIVGIAAQQTLGNFFAGLVLMFARPYVPGQRVKIHSGALGGPFEGVIVGAGLAYTWIETADGVVSLPNSGVLGSAIGPAAPADQGSEAADS